MESGPLPRAIQITIAPPSPSSGVVISPRRCSVNTCATCAAGGWLLLLLLSAVAVLVAAPSCLWVGMHAVASPCNARVDGTVHVSGADTVGLRRCSLNVTYEARGSSYTAIDLPGGCSVQLCYSWNDPSVVRVIDPGDDFTSYADGKRFVRAAIGMFAVGGGVLVIMCVSICT
jgi:hypothetical protein